MVDMSHSLCEKYPPFSLSASVASHFIHVPPRH